MKVFLVFPPPWTPAMPYLALPVLTAVLRAQGVEVIQRDLNLETYDTVLSRAYLKRALQRLRAMFPHGWNGRVARIDAGRGGSQTRPYKPAPLPEKLTWAFDEGPRLAAQIDAAKAVFRSQAFY